MTPFRDFMRKIRLKQSILLKDCANRLEVSSAYLSALEHGKKGSPSESMIQKIETILKLNESQKQDLRIAIQDSNTCLKLSSNLSPLAFQTANRLVRKLPNLSSSQLEAILKILAN